MPDFTERFNGVEGSAVRRIFDLLADPEIISFAGGNPNPKLFPSAVLGKLANELLDARGDSVLQYGSTFGWAELRELIRHIKKHEFKDYDDIIMLSGSSQGIDLFTRSLIDKGDRVLAESPTFLGALQVFYFSQAEVIGVPLQNDGPDIEILEEQIKKYKPKFYYTVPTFQNPSGITMSAEKRRLVYDICYKYGTLILEDDPYAELRYSGEPQKSIKSLDGTGTVCKLGSFSKTISPGLRVGYAIADKEIIKRFNLIKQGEDVHTSNLGQSLVCKFLTDGYFELHLNALCVEYKKHRDTMLDCIKRFFGDKIEYTHPDGGLFIWAKLPEEIDAEKYFDLCVKQKVAFVPGRPFFADGGGKNNMRLNFSMPSIGEIEIGTAKMAKVLDEMLK